jgi:hypothetical protein
MNKLVYLNQMQSFENKNDFSANLKIYYLLSSAIIINQCNYFQIHKTLSNQSAKIIYLD